MTDVISVYAPSYDPYDGYGRMMLELVYHLSAQGIHVNPMTVPRGKVFYDTHSPALRELLNRPIKATVGGIVMGYPTLYEEYGELAKAGPRIAITMFESTKLPEGWVAALNQCDAVIVPAKWQVEAFRDCGVHVPMHVVPLGVSETFKPVNGMVQRPVRDHAGRTAREPYTFLTIGDRGAARKGWDVAMLAFVEAFGDRDDVRLLVKTREKQFAYEMKNANIEVLQADLDEYGLNDLYNAVDCMVFPSRGEGFGLPPREFAATGGPALATEWWADDIQQWGYRIEYKMKTAWGEHSKFKGLGRWAEPDGAHCTKQMLHVFNQDPNIVAYMGMRSMLAVRKLYSWATFAERVWGIWQDVTKAPVPATTDRRRRAKRASI